MNKNATYKEKLQLLNPWLPRIFDTIKKDLRQEHLHKYPAFSKQYFPQKNLQKLTPDELATGYMASVNEGAEDLGELITQLWMLKNTEVYSYFEQELTKINPKFTEIEQLTPQQSEIVIKGSTDQFGLVRTYIFSVMNSVAFPVDFFEKMHAQALKEHQEKQEQRQAISTKNDVEGLKKEHEQQMARLTDKYEKKLSGLQKKYLLDVAGLKKQLSNLQKKWDLHLKG